MPEPLPYLQAMVAAAAVSAVIVLATMSLWRREGRTRLDAACVLGMGLGLASGYFVLSLRVSWPPASSLDRFLTIVLPVALGIQLITGFEGLPRSAAWLLRISLSAAIPRILLHGSTYLSGSARDWTDLQAWTVLFVCSALIAGLWVLLSALSKGSSDVSISLALCFSILCAGLTVMMAGYIKGGSAAFPLAAALAATTVGARFSTPSSATRTDGGTEALLGIGVVGLSSLLLIGRFFGRLSTGCALAILLAPVLCWATELPLLRSRNPWHVGFLRLVLVAIPLLVVLGIAWRDFHRDMVPLL